MREFTLVKKHLSVKLNNLHNQKHAGEKPCKSQTCNKHFSTNSALKIHEKRTHKLSQSSFHFLFFRFQPKQDETQNSQSK